MALLFAPDRLSRLTATGSRRSEAALLIPASTSEPLDPKNCSCGRQNGSVTSRRLPSRRGTPSTSSAKHFSLRRCEPHLTRASLTAKALDRNDGATISNTTATAVSVARRLAHFRIRRSSHPCELAPNAAASRRLRNASCNVALMAFCWLCLWRRCSDQRTGYMRKTLRCRRPRQLPWMRARRR